MQQLPSIDDECQEKRTRNLEKALGKFNIQIQAYHSRSFTRNHCAKYLRGNVLNAISDSIVTKNQNINW